VELNSTPSYVSWRVHRQIRLSLYIVLGKLGILHIYKKCGTLTFSMAWGFFLRS